MTEQEKREKAIEEAEAELIATCNMSAGKINYHEAVTTLIDTGYRKEKEVQKETSSVLYKKVNALLLENSIMANYEEKIKALFNEQINKKWDWLSDLLKGHILNLMLESGKIAAECTEDRLTDWED